MVNWLRMALVLVLAFGAVACGSNGDGDDGEAELTIANASSCEQLADAFMPLMQGILDNVAEMSLEEIMSEDEPEFIGELEGRFQEAEVKSGELDCNDEMEALIGERIDQLTAEGPAGEIFLTVLKQEFQ